MVLLAGRYEVGRLLGSGGMARVIAGRDLALDRPVAIKLIRDELVGDRAMRERLLREARGAAGLQHPNTVAVHDVGEHDGVPFVVMELVDGRTLADALRAEGRLTEDRTAEIIDGVLAGLAAAHDRGLIHRDVKPSNILLPSAGGVKLADFGIARELAAGATRLTTTGQLLGTPQYTAPEQTAGRPATAASDVYSVGVVAYECLAGRPPFEAETPIGLAIAHEREPVPPLSRAVPGLHGPLVAVVERSLAKEPEARFDGAAAMREALRTAVAVDRMPMSPRAGTQPLDPPLPADARPTDGTRPMDTTRSLDTKRLLTRNDEPDASAPPTATTHVMDDTRQRRRFPLLPATAVAMAVAGALVLLVLNSETTDEGDDGADPPAENVDEAVVDDVVVDEDAPPPEPASDLADLILALARDPEAAGDKGEDLLDDLRQLRDEADVERRRRAARELIIDIAAWLVEGELDPDVGRNAIDVLEAEGRPARPELEDTSTLFAHVAANMDDWGENADDLLDELDELLGTGAPGRLARDARELADEIEGWVDDRELDRGLGASAIDVLRRLGRRS